VALKCQTKTLAKFQADRIVCEKLGCGHGGTSCQHLNVGDWGIFKAGHTPPITEPSAGSRG
jgi:hypothetical protein